MGKGMRGRGGPPAAFRPAGPVAAGAAPQLTALFVAAVQAHEAGRVAEAEQRYRQVLSIDADHADALHNLGVLVGQLGRHDLAVGLLGKAVSLRKRDPRFHANYGVALKNAKRWDEAADAYRRAIALNPRMASAHHTLGDILRDQGKFDLALASIKRAIALDPKQAKFHVSLGATLQAIDKFTEAAACYARGLELAPDSTEAHNNIGDVLAHQGYVDEAVKSYERALAAAPNNFEADSRRLIWLGYSPSISAEGLLAEHRLWDTRHAGEAPARVFPNVRDPERRLRIGYISGHYRRHPVGFFLAKVLEAHDKAKVASICYSFTVMVDDVTDRLKAAADHWRNLVPVPDSEALAAVLRDQVDVLVDLSGHTPGNQLPMFARRLAPVQASWLGYPSTTGLAAMDYLIMDQAAVPPGSERWCSEALVRLPYGRFCYAPPDYAPSPAEAPPSIAKGHVTFGSFNQLTKIGPDVVRLWARVLEAVPNSRLVLKWVALGDVTARKRLTDAFAAEGLDLDRLELRGHSPHAEMLAQYADIDIALDPFPFCGGLTTCEALWMGLPLVTLPGQRPASRQSLGFLKTLGLDDLIADSEGDYVRIAQHLAADVDRRSDLRRSLRPRMAASPLCDAALFTPTLEAAYRGMWKRWCAGEAPAAFDVPPLSIG